MSQDLKELLLNQIAEMNLEDLDSVWHSTFPGEDQEEFLYLGEVFVENRGVPVQFGKWMITYHEFVTKSGFIAKRLREPRRNNNTYESVIVTENSFNHAWKRTLLLIKSIEG